jgi:predicted dehydrogenase
MKNTIINIGIIGFGKTGKERFKILQKEKKVKIHSICDQLEIKKKYKEINYTNNPEILIKNKEITAVFISVPNYLNKKLVIKCLKNNKHVFCEKPPTLNSKEMLEVIKIEKKTKLKLMYGFNHRHHESVQRMKKIIDTNQLGKVLWMRGRYGKSVDKNFFDTWRSKKKYSGGGILIDQGIHMIDLFLYLAGNFNKIQSSISNLYWKSDIEDNAFVILENTKNKISASLHSTMTQWRHLFSLEIFLEKGYLVLNGLITSSKSYGDEILAIVKNRTITPEAKWKKVTHKRYKVDNSFKNEVNEFFDAIINDKPILNGNSKDALELMVIIDKIYN